MCKKEMPFLCFMPSSPVGNKQTPPGGTAGRPIFEYFFWKKPNLLCFLYLDLVRVLLFFASGSSFFGWVGGVGRKNADFGLGDGERKLRCSCRKRETKF